MSLITDWIGVGAALAVAAGSGIQATQAFAEVNAKTPLISSVIPLLRAALQTLFSVVIRKTDVERMAARLVNLKLLALTPAQAAVLTPAQTAALIPAQTAALDAGHAIALTPAQFAMLTPDQVTTLTADQVKDLKKWLGLFLGWLFISIGALAALAGAALMLAIDW
jgi:hypothetical protein